jgi:hypothetical protein
MLSDYFADIAGDGSRCFLMDCELTGQSIRAVFAYWAAKQRGEVMLGNERGDRIIINIPEFVWDLKNDEFLYKAEYPILGKQDAE